MLDVRHETRKRSMFERAIIAFNSLCDRMSALTHDEQAMLAVMFVLVFAPLLALCVYGYDIWLFGAAGR